MTRPAAEVLQELAAVAADEARLASRRAHLYVDLAAALRLALAPAPASPAAASSEYVDTREAANLLGVSARTLEGLRAQGLGPDHIRIGRAVRYPRAALSAVRAPSAAPAPVPSGSARSERSR